MLQEGPGAEANPLQWQLEVSDALTDSQVCAFPGTVGSWSLAGLPLRPTCLFPPHFQQHLHVAVTASIMLILDGC